MAKVKRKSVRKLTVALKEKMEWIEGAICAALK